VTRRGHRETRDACERLAGRTIVIAGAAGGMGAAQADLFAAQGLDLVLGDLNCDEAARVADSIGPAAAWCSLDVREEADWQSLPRLIGGDPVRHVGTR
jgi:3alpha(or 20beta)-hydroxysteroid dehydrogenase